MSLITRNQKGSPLSINEMDNNLLYLESEAKNKLWEEDGLTNIKPSEGKRIDAFYVDNLPIVSYNRILFVSKEGNDLNNGESESSSLLTISRALELGDSESEYLIKVLDNGIYEEDLIVGENICIYAPNAILRGSLTIGDCVTVKFHIISASDNNQTLINNIGCSGKTIVEANRIEGSGSESENFNNNKIVQNLSSDGSIIIDAKVINVSNVGYFIYSVNLGGDDERTASNNNWTGTGDVINASNVWVNSTLSALATWGSNTGPMLNFIDDPSDLNAQSLEYIFTTQTVINKINIFQYATWMASSSPSEFKIYARNIDIPTWDELYHHVGGLGYQDNIFEFSNTTPYEIYKIIWLNSTSSNNNFIRVSRISMFNSDTQVGGEIKFNIERINQGDGSLCILSESDTCDYSGYINEVNAVNAAFVVVNNGRVSLTSNKINSLSLYEIYGGKLIMNVLDYEGSVVKMGGELRLPNISIT